MLLLLFSTICLNVSIMLIWFRSDAFIEWMKIFGFEKIIKYQEYLDAKLDNFSITYPLFLKLKYRKFIFKILGCPLCLCVWLSIFQSIIVSKFTNTSLITFMCGIIIYSPIILISSLYIYYKLNNLSNENK